MRVLIGLLLVVFSFAVAEAKVKRPPQFVLLGFDGSKDTKFWKESRAFARKHNIKFTYFISGVYFLARAHRKKYHEPKRGPGRSAIGYGGKAKDIALRLKQVSYAHNEGHEIASHANAHFNGASYSKSQWESELTQFQNIMLRSWSRYSSSPEPKWWQSYFKNEIDGFRAPALGTGPGLFKALRTKGYKYDTSLIRRWNYWPEKLGGIWNFPLASLRMAGTKRRTLSMDYNFYVADSLARRGSPSKFGHYEERMYKTYMAYFRNNYSDRGNRAPIHIGHHFSKWNGGAYWRAMKRFAKSVCGKPEVICGTYKQLTRFMEKHKGQISAYRNRNFAPMNGKPSKTYEPEKQVVALAKPEPVAKKKTPSPKPKKPNNAAVKKPSTVSKATNTNDPNAIYDAGLKRPNLAALSEEEQQAYWTRVWYAGKGIKPPASVVAKTEALVSDVKTVTRKTSQEKTVTRPTRRPNIRLASVRVKPTRKVTKAKRKSTAKPSKKKKTSGIYDGGLKRPNLSAMSEAERTAYWTKVWYAKKKLRAKQSN